MTVRGTVKLSYTVLNIDIVLFPGDCPDLPDPENGHVYVEGFINGSSAAYHCHKNYTLQGNIRRTCDEDMWTGCEPVCLSKLYWGFQNLFSVF